MFKKLLLLSTLLLSSAVIGDEIKPLPNVINGIVNSGGKLQSSFDTNIMGMKGWVFAKGMEDQIIYSSPDGNYAFVGVIVDSNGMNVTTNHYDLYGYVPSMNDQFFELEEKASWIAFGDDNPEKVIYVFHDFNCSFCKKTWDTMSDEFLNEHNVQVRYIPVAFRGAISLDKTIAVLSSDDMQKEFAKQQNNYGKVVVDKPEKNKEILKKIEINHQFFKMFGLSGTPSHIYMSISKKVALEEGHLGRDKLPTIFDDILPIAE